MKLTPVFTLFYLLLASASFAQVAINSDASQPDNSAMLDVKSNGKGFLLPRMTQAQRDLVPSPATGLMIYQTNGTPGFYYNAGTPGSPNWILVNSQWLNNGNKIYYNTANVGIGTNDPTGILHIRGAEWNSRPVMIENNTTGIVGPTLSFKTPTCQYDIIGATGSGASTGANHFAIWDNMASTYRFVIGPAGNVGIGMNILSAVAKFQVDDNTFNYVGYFRNTFIGNSDRRALYALSKNNPGFGTGIQAEGGYMGGYFEADAPGYNASIYGVYALANGSGGSGNRYGVYGFATGGTTNYGGYFNGNVHVTGTLSKAAGTFKIDHPQDPENKYLVHSFVESPDMMNIYTGIVTTDANGMATAELPSYFESLNIQYTYQLTVVKQFAQAIIQEEISGNKFTIKTDKPNVKVSWMVTGVRNDPYAKENRIVPEVEKSAEDKGKYLYPAGYGFKDREDKLINPPPKKDKVPAK
jgi:hypothetical protein